MKTLNEYRVSAGGQTLVVREVSHAAVAPMIEEHHYSHKTTKNVWKSYGVYVEGADTLQGAMQIGYGIRPKLKAHMFDSPPESVREFDRMYLTDALPRNSESAVIAGLLRHLKKTAPEVVWLITYADGIRGKVGTIYQATNATYIGAVAGEFYILPSGEYVHPVSMWHKHKTRAKKFLEATYPGYRHVRGPQHRYVYCLAPKECAKLKLHPQPYPRAESTAGGASVVQTGGAGSIPSSALTTQL